MPNVHRRPARATRRAVPTRRAVLTPRHRRVLAAALAALAAGGTAYLALDRPVLDAVPVLVAVRELPVGHRLTEGDVRLQDLPDPAHHRPRRDLARLVARECR